MMFAMHETPQQAANRKLADDQRARQLMKLRAASPMRSSSPQRDAGDLALFVAGNEPSLI